MAARAFACRGAVIGAVRSAVLRAGFGRLEALVGWAKARSLRAVPTMALPLVGTLRFAHPTCFHLIGISSGEGDSA
jgi:hypothetical protein